MKSLRWRKILKSMGYKKVERNKFNSFVMFYENYDIKRYIFKKHVYKDNKRNKVLMNRSGEYMIRLAKRELGD